MHLDWVMGCWRRNNGNFGWRFGKALKMGRDIAAQRLSNTGRASRNATSELFNRGTRDIDLVPNN